MSSTVQSRWRTQARRGALTITLLSTLALLASILLSVSFPTLEGELADLRVRWRHRLDRRFGRGTPPDRQPVVLLAIDAQTQATLGKSRNWFSRQQYFDQLAFFEAHLRPSVLAYDVIFQSPLGSAAGPAASVSETPRLLDGIRADLERIAGDPSELMTRESLENMSRLASEQGDMTLAHRFASAREGRAFASLVAYNFRGGAVDPQAASVPPWSPRDICGEAPDGDEEAGQGIPYLKDVAIPDEDIVFRQPGDRLAYGYSVNANLPSRDILDYTRLGFINVPRDQDSVVRRVPLVLGFAYENPSTHRARTVFVPSFSLMACLQHWGVEFPLTPGTVRVRFGDRVEIRAPGVRRDIPIDGQGRLFLDFAHALTDFPAVSFAATAIPGGGAAGDAALRRHAAELARVIDGRIAMVGLTTTGEDVGATPVGASVPLVFVHMTAATEILSGRFMRPLDRAGLILVYAALWILVSTISQLHGGRYTGAMLGLALGYTLVAYAGVHLHRVVLPVLGPLFYFGLCAIAVLSYRFATEERAKRKIRTMFSTMVSGQVLEYLEEHPDSFSLQGHTVDATVFFSDVAGFTEISERLPAHRLTALLNAYLTPCTNCILNHGGYLDKYVGDQVMAVWGAPFSEPDHAFKACQCALEQQRIIQAMNGRLEQDFGVRLQVRMGINSGSMTAGNMGSQRKFQYTVMGDAVNLAARLEPCNKDLGTTVLIGEQTRRQAGDRVVVRRVGRVVVLGRSAPAEVFELLGLAGRVDAAVSARIRRFEEALDRYMARDWEGCLRLLDDLLAAHEDPVARSLRGRAAQAARVPPPAGWLGEFIQVDKG